jgi:hypothetical protein
MRLNNAYSKCDIPSLSAGYNRCNIGGTMIPYNILRQVEGDTDKYANYYVNVYQSPPSENSVLIRRNNEVKRIQRSFVNSVKQSLINNN